MKLRKLFIVLIFAFGYIFSVGYSSWAYLTNTTSVATAKANDVTINVHFRKYKNTFTTTTSIEDEYIDDLNGTNGVLENSLAETTYSPKYNEGDVFGDKTLISTETTPVSSTVSITKNKWKQKYISKRVKGSRSLGGNKYTYYSNYKYWTEVITITRDAPDDVETSYKYKVSVGSFIKPSDFVVDGHSQYGFYSDSNYTSLFDFSKPVTINTTDIYVKYVQGGSSLASSINGYSSGTYVFYDSNRGSSSSATNKIDVSTDTSYDSSSRIAYLDQCTINQNVNIQLVYGSGNVNNESATAISDDDATKNGHRNSSAFQNLEDGLCSTKLCLRGDLTVKGTLTISANIGSKSNGGSMSHIIGNYSQIDLYGNDLIIDGGIVYSYGSIVDSIGTGNVIVKNGGTIISMLTIQDGKGGNQMTYGYSKGQAPFQEYRLLYIEAKLIAYHGANIKGYVILDLGSLGMSTVFLNLIGSSPSIFSRGTKVSDNDVFIIEPYIVNSLYGTSDSTLNRYMLYYRYKVIFNSNVILNNKIPLSATVNFKGLAKHSVELDLARIGVPISPFFDIIVKSGYTFTLKTQVYFLYGSSLFSETGSTINFNSGEVITYKEVKIQVRLLNVKVYIIGETKRVHGGIMAFGYSHNMFNGYGPRSNPYGTSGSSLMRKSTNISNHIIKGDITFDSMPDDTKYKISGCISLSKNALSTILNSSYVTTYDIKGEQVGSIWFNGQNTTYEASVNTCEFFNCLPLISNDYAYIKDNQYNLKGKFDLKSGVFTSLSNTKYILLTPTDFLIGGSDKSNQNALTDFTVNVVKLSNTIDNYIVKNTSGSYYVYYCGIFVPVLSDSSEAAISDSTTYISVYANIRKFCSNNNSGAYTNSTLYDKQLLNYNSSTALWQISKTI